jgi:hypothetical protein
MGRHLPLPCTGICSEFVDRFHNNSRFDKILKPVTEGERPPCTESRVAAIVFDNVDRYTAKFRSSQ